jgi:lysophospholipase L1-like esterase
MRVSITGSSHLKRLLYILLILLPTACSNGVPGISSLDSNAVVLAFGNSLTFGTGTSTAESYPAVLEGLIHRKVINAGVPGEVTGQGLARLPEFLDRHQPALLILCHGGNDLLRRTGEEQAADNVRAMIKMAKERGIDVALIGVPKPGLSVPVAGFYEEIAREFDIPYEGEILVDILSTSSLKSDMIHPNSQGYAELAQSIAALLRKAKAI